MSGVPSTTVPPRKRRLSPFAATVPITLAVYAVLAAVLSLEPPASVPTAVARAVARFPHVIAGVNTAALICLLAGWRAVTASPPRLQTHRRYMLAAVVLISTFLILYVTRVALSGIKAFAGPGAVRTYVYLPALTVHITLSILSVPLVVHNVFIGLTFPLREVRRSGHPRAGRVAVALWAVSLALGIAVYLMLNVVY